jgi:hypothetical protein
MEDHRQLISAVSSGLPHYKLNLGKLVKKVKNVTHALSQYVPGKTEKNHKAASQDSQ